MPSTSSSKLPTIPSMSLPRCVCASKMSAPAGSSPRSSSSKLAKSAAARSSGSVTLGIYPRRATRSRGRASEAPVRSTVSHVVTADEIGQVAIFAGLNPADRERLARVAADLSLTPGDYAAHEGDGRALFAVLEGRIEPVKLVDGVERVLGVRNPGDIFGEVPVTL